MSKYDLSLDVSNYGRLDEFALLASQTYNLGNQGSWFNAFRGGLNGLHARLHGLVTHYDAVHAWIPIPRIPSETEHHIASIFFCMDSAVECLTFALNALGYGSSPQQFRDVTNESSLRKISPKDIIDEDSAKSNQSLPEGYKIIFPNLKKYWQTKKDVLMTIIEQHDVSKHRETIFTGGQVRSDPPPRFYELPGPRDDQEMQWIYSPMAEIILKSNPKSAYASRRPQEVKDTILLEDLTDQFIDFLRESGKMALQDAKSNIKLKHENFIEQGD